MTKQLKFTKPKISIDKNGNYIVQVYVNGKRFKQRISRKLDDKEKEIEAIAISENWSEMLVKGYSPFCDEDILKYYKIYGDPIVNDKIDEFLDTIKEEKTRNSYKSKLKLLKTNFGELKVEDVKKFHVENLINSQVQNGTYAQSTVVHAIKIFRAFFNWCVNENIIQKSPLKKFKKIISTKDIEDKNVPFSDKHFSVIMKELKKPKFKLIFTFASFLYHAHIRPNEIRQLVKRDINLEKNVITIRSSTAKNDKKDILPIYPPLRDVILSMGLENIDDDDYIFYREDKNKRRHQLSQSYISDRFRNLILKPLGLWENTGYNFYSFKAKASLDKIKMGWSVVEVQKINRHSNIQQTLTYLKNSSKVTEIHDLPFKEI